VASLKYSELEEKLFEIKEKMAELQQEFQLYKDTYSLPKTVLAEGYTFQAKWRVHPEELSYSMQFHRGKNVVFEVVQGEFFKIPNGDPASESVLRRAQEVHQLLVDWLTNQIDWPFDQEEFPRVV
jgi:hypothetical protein